MTGACGDGCNKCYALTCALYCRLFRCGVSHGQNGSGRLICTMRLWLLLSRAMVVSILRSCRSTRIALDNLDRMRHWETKITTGDMGVSFQKSYCELDGIG
ncbi:hypothetical protein L914_21558 [Phytophthora nicotianae]|uniref:Uncharacterized protein n=3 Tax=Phytophthora nicotianae TaxID=4792 RepID=V9DS44_PHYNI|nr:hypothetical protein F443_23160 [Phytophthora nicotianae P1569]ETM30765.1 hypothetical protein L914_21558 [Phytophthora nicotianae]ETO73152.1 hypothetical protein F444_10875 [Phytophthora nicotianae P1976]